MNYASKFALSFGICTIVLIIAVLVIVIIDYESSQNIDKYINNGLYPHDNKLKPKGYAVGNKLSAFFYYMYKSFRIQKAFIWPTYHDQYGEKKMLGNLPTVLHVKDEYLVDILKIRHPSMFSKAFWWPEAEWEHFHKLWTPMKPIVTEILHDTYEKMVKDENIEAVKKYDNNTVVLHLRCGDEPFKRSKNYELQKYRYYIECINSFENKDNIKNLVVVYGSRLKEESKQCVACNTYVQDLIDFIIEHTNIEQHEIVSSSADSDFFTMMFCQNLIIGHSSFSFFAALANKTGQIRALRVHKKSVNHGDNWKYMQAHVLKHIEVKDYYKTDKVITKLKS